MVKLLFATNNQHKVEEMRAALDGLVEVISLKEAGLNINIPEPHNTIEENASEKSSVLYSLTGISCFSEDSGLEVLSLGGEPGVHSARYSGEGGSSNDNIEKLLDKLKAKTDRRARFRTVISLIWKGSEHLFEGTCEGMIIEERRGNKGFGYDPVFVPAGSTLSFGEMDLRLKNSFSHRKKAADRLVSFLQQNK